MKPIVAILDDDSEALLLLAKTLGDEYQAMTFTNEELLLEYLKNNEPDLFLLDILLHEESGFEVCKRIKSIDHLKRKPIIFLSGKKEVSDKITGFTIGADDYVEKPFNVMELKLRIAARLKNKSGNELVSFKGLSLNRITLSVNEVLNDGMIAPLNLTLSEYKILDHLLRNVNGLVSREDLLILLNNNSSDTSDRVVDVHISNLKKKSPTLKNHLKSVYGEGYKLVL